MKDWKSIKQSYRGCRYKRVWPSLAGISSKLLAGGYLTSGFHPLRFSTSTRSPWR